MVKGCKLRVKFALQIFWRRERDLNPRSRFYSEHTISNRAPSAARASLRDFTYGEILLTKSTINFKPNLKQLTLSQRTSV